MGIFDFFRRTTATPTVGASNVDRSSATDSIALDDSNRRASTTGSSSDSPLVEHSDSGPAEVDELSSKTLPVAPPAWSLLAPIATVAQRSMLPSFDTGVAATLRTLRGPSDVFVSSALSHTVNRKASGVVDCLLTPSAMPLGFAAWQSDSHQVLRRQYPTTAELPALDVAHSRWPILSRVAAESGSVAPASGVPRPASFPVSVLAMEEVRRKSDGLMPSDVAYNLIHRSEAEESGPTSPSSVVTSVPDWASNEPSDASAEPLRSTIGRSLPLVSAEAGLSRTTLPKPEPTMAAFAAPVISRRAASSDGEQSEPPAVPTLMLPSASTRSTLSTRSIVTSDPIVDGATGSRSSMEPANLQRSVGEFTSLRRRSIIEMPSTSPTSPSSADDGPTKIGPSSVELFDPSPSSPTSPLAIDRTSDALNVGEVASSVGQSPAASRPTLGRKAGLGEPMSAIPASALVALRDEGSSDPFAGWNDESPDLELARTSDPDSSEVRPSSTLTDSSFTLSRSADESGSTSVSAPMQTTSVPDSYLRVVSDSGQIERPELDAESSGPLPTTADRPLLGDQSILHRSTEGLSTEGLLASASVLEENSRTGKAVPVQRMSTVPNATSAGDMQRKQSSIEMISAQSNGPNGSDSFSGVSPRQLQRVSDSTASPNGSEGKDDQPDTISRLSAPVISRSDIAPIHRVPLARLSATDSASLSPRSHQSGSASRAPGQGQSALPSIGGSSSPGGSLEPSSGRLALLERAIDRNGPSPSSSWGVASGFMQREDESNVTQSGAKVMETRSKYPNVNENGPSPTFANETYKSTNVEKEHIPTSENETSPKTWIYPAPPEASSQAQSQAQSEAPAGAATTGATATGSSAQAETDVEMLAGRIYDRIRNRLRRELLDDRERAGLTLDRVR
jgi:hypothetical protein